MDKVRKKSINRQLIRELQEEFLDTPTEIFNKGEGFSSDHLARHTRDKQRYFLNLIFLKPHSYELELIFLFSDTRKRI